MELSRARIIAVLAEVARCAAYEADKTRTHPVDIGATMAAAIESAAITLDVLMHNGVPGLDQPD